HFGFDQDNASIESVRRSDGTIAPYRGALRREQASVQYETQNGIRWEAGMFATGAHIGVGGAVTKPDPRGNSTIRVEIGRAYWDFAESLANGGTRDRIELSREVTAGPRVSVNADTSWNRYNLREVSNAAESVAAQGRVNVLLLSHPRLDFEY